MSTSVTGDGSVIPASVGTTFCALLKNAQGAWEEVPVGSAGTILTSTGTSASWQASQAISPFLNLISTSGSPLVASASNQVITTSAVSLSLPTAAAQGSYTWLISSTGATTITMGTGQSVVLGSTIITGGTIVLQGTNQAILFYCTASNNVFQINSITGSVTLVA